MTTATTNNNETHHTARDFSDMILCLHVRERNEEIQECALLVVVFIVSYTRGKNTLECTYTSQFIACAR